MKITILSVIFSFLPVLNSWAMDADEIVKKADLKRGLGNISHSFEVDISNSSNKNESFTVYFKDVNTTLIDQTAPERARGKKLLMKDYDMWLITKNVKKPIRISLEQKLTGEVSNGDIARTNYAADYSATIIEEDKNSYKLDLRAKNKKVTYAQIHYIVDKKDYAPIEATFFAVSGKKLKSAHFSGFKMIDGMLRSTIMTINDYIQKDKVSTLTFKNHKKEQFNDSLFNKDRLN